MRFFLCCDLLFYFFHNILIYCVLLHEQGQTANGARKIIQKKSFKNLAVTQNMRTFALAIQK